MVLNHASGSVVHSTHRDGLNGWVRVPLQGAEVSIAKVKVKVQ